MTVTNGLQSSTIKILTVEKSLKVLDLFSGIGGMSLGLQMTGGFQTVAFCEIESFPQRVLKKHWPHVPLFTDVRELNQDALSRNGIHNIDVITGGFPCQPHSMAGKRLASLDERDLWAEFARLIGEIKPRWVLAENVRGLLSSADPVRGRHYKGAFFGRVVSDLDALGYVGEWHCIPASSFGAPHQRDRIWILAYPESIRRAACRKTGAIGRATPLISDRPELAHSLSVRWETWGQDDPQHDRSVSGANGQNPPDVAHTQSQPSHDRPDHPGSGVETTTKRESGNRGGAQTLAHANSAGGKESHAVSLSGHPSIQGFPDWAGGEVGQPSPITEFERPGGREVERDFRGVSHGVSNRVDRIRGLGNAVVPQVVAWIGQQILKAEP